MRFDVTTPRAYKDRDGNEKTNWVRLGTAFEKEGRITVLLDALPIADSQGVCKMILMEPKQGNGNQSGGQNRGSNGSYRNTPAERREFAGARDIVSRRDELSDDIPF